MSGKIPAQPRPISLFMNLQDSRPAYAMAGLFTLSLRLVAGWTCFSAFWRRVALDNKLIPDQPGYIGEKFNHFLPNALGIKPLIHYLVTHPDALRWSMIAFTLIEGIVGLLLLLGLLSRLMSIGVFMLSAGILLGSGWIGTTCLDEWQIGVLGLAAGFSLFLSGGGPISLDGLFRSSSARLNWLASGPLGWRPARLRQTAIAGALFIFFVTLFTNQYFHGGVWGKLHNKSVRPKLEITGASLSRQQLSFEIFRVEGVDVYGSFLIGIALQDAAGKEWLALDGKALSQFPKEKIRNRYVAKIKPGKHALIVPLGAKAQVHINDAKLEALPPGSYRLVLTDVSGLSWSAEVKLPG
jgi:thiosulfate dehydrogenase [quinone] large subunit